MSWNDRVNCRYKSLQISCELLQEQKKNPSVVAYGAPEVTATLGQRPNWPRIRFWHSRRLVATIP